MKMYKKSKLTLNHGLLVSKDGDIVLPDYRIVQQANALETMIQKAAYLMAQPEATPMPSLDGFERRSIDDSETRKFKVDTPTMDAKAEEAMKLMDEIDDMATADKANAMLDDFKSFLDFVTQDFVVDGGDQLYKFDTPMLGDVLKLTETDVVNAIAYVCGMAEEKDDDEPTCGIAIPATKENFDKVMEFFASFSDKDDNDMKTNSSSNEKMDGEGIMNSLNKLACDVNDLCNDIEEASSMGNTKE